MSRAAAPALLLLTLAAGPALPQAPAPRLAVFAPGAGRPAHFQRLLADALPGVEVVVYGRPADLARALKEDPPDALLAPGPLLEQEGLKPALKGLRSGAESEPWLLVSVDGRVDLERAPGAALALVDVLGRKQLPRLAARVLGLEQAPRVTGVTRTGDLLAVLELEQADAVLIPESALGELRASSRLRLVAVRAPGAVALPAMARVRGADTSALETRLKALPPALLGRLGVEGWR